VTYLVPYSPTPAITNKNREDPFIVNQLKIPQGTFTPQGVLKRVQLGRVKFCVSGNPRKIKKRQE